MRSPIREAQKRQQQRLGPAKRMEWRGEVHYGWWLYSSGSRWLVTMCGAAEHCDRRAKLTTRKVNCSGCLKRAKETPDLITKG